MEDVENGSLEHESKRRVYQICSSSQNPDEEIPEGWRCPYCIAYVVFFSLLSVLYVIVGVFGIGNK